MGIIDDVVGGVETVVEDVVEGVETAVHVVVEGVETAVHEVVDGVETAVHEVEKFAETVVVDVVDVVETVVDEVVALEKGAEHLAEDVIHEIEDVVHGVEEFGEDVVHEIGDAVHDVENFAETIFHGVVDAAEKLINIVEGLLIVGIAKRTGADPADVGEIHLPKVKMGKVWLAGLTLEEVEIAATLLLTNPNSIPLPLVQISSSVVVGGKTVASFDAKVCTIAAHGSGNVDLLLTVNYLELIKDVAYDIATGIVEFQLKVELTIEMPDAGRHTFPYEWEVKLPLPIVPFLALAQVGVKPPTPTTLSSSNSSGQESSSSTEIVLYLTLDNPNVFDLDLNSLQCQVSLADVIIGSVERKEPAVKFGKKTKGGLKIPFSFEPKKFGQEFCQKMNGRSIGYSLQGTIDVGTPHGPMKMPIVMKQISTGTSIPLIDVPRA